MRRVGKKALIKVYKKFFSSIEYTKTIEKILEECNDKFFAYITEIANLEPDLQVIKGGIELLYLTTKLMDEKLKSYDITVLDSFQSTLVVKDLYYIDNQEDINKQVEELRNSLRKKLYKKFFNISTYTQLDNIIDSLLDVPENLSIEDNNTIEVIHDNMINYVISSVRIKMINVFGKDKVYEGIIECLENKLREIELPVYVLRQQFTDSV